MLWLILTGFAAFAWTYFSINIVLSRPHMRAMGAVEPPEEPGPMLSVIVPARNEEKALPRCLESLAGQTYANLDVIVINDRSTDATGRIADEAAARSGGRIRVVHVAECPAGWLGKCNAMRIGAEAARGEYLLFTDGDVIFTPDALARAMGEMVREGADHLVTFPSLITHSFSEDVVLAFFALGFLAAMPANLVVDAASKTAIGVGAFNLVRRSTYERLGGHTALRLNVLDDVQLGELMKAGGAKFRLLVGGPHVRVRWHESAWGVIRGLEKNAFANVDYNVPRVMAAMMFILVIFVWPFFGVFVGPMALRITCGVMAGMIVIAGAIAAKAGGLRAAAGLFLPIGALGMVVAFVRSAWITQRQGGVRWRDSFYSSAELKAWMREFRARKRQLWSEMRSGRGQ